MAIFRRPLAEQAKGTLGEEEDWWNLCYDDEKRQFFVEHRWHHINKKNIAEPPYTGSEHISIASFDGPGQWLIDDLEDELLEEAGHD